MMPAREWSEADIRQLIFQEVSSDETMRHSSASTQGLVDTTHEGFAETMRAFEIQAGQITAQGRNFQQDLDEMRGLLNELQTVDPVPRRGSQGKGRDDWPTGRRPAMNSSRVLPRARSRNSSCRSWKWKPASRARPTRNSGKLTPQLPQREPLQARATPDSRASEGPQSV